MSIEPVGDDNLISFWQEGKPALDIGFKLSKSDFDALREHDRKTREVEQNRIIKLLDEVTYTDEGFLAISSDLQTFKDLEALIKGEQK